MIVLIIDLTAKVTTRLGLFHLFFACNLSFLFAFLALDRYPAALQRYLYLRVARNGVGVKLIALGDI